MQVVLIDLSSPEAVMRSKPVFWSRVEVKTPPECWPWKLACTGRSGYGHFKFAGQQLVAHRVAYQIAYGVAPGALFVCHKCDNPPCCNPLHLFLGTPKDNTQDMIRKGRRVQPRYTGKFNIGEWKRAHGGWAVGSAHPRAKMVEADASRIKQMLRSGVARKEIAAIIGCKKYTVDAIALGRQWRHVP